MHKKIWIINLEEVVGHRYLEKLLLKHFCRYLLCVDPGDIYISAVKIPEDFLKYISTLLKFNHSSSWLKIIKKPTDPYYICDSILQDHQLMNFLKELGDSGEFILEPFFESARVLQLSDETGIPVKGSLRSAVENRIIHNINDKIHFKNMAKELGIPVIDDRRGISLNEIKEGINEISKLHGGSVVVKKSFSGGGLGNIHGAEDHLLSLIDQWYELSDYLVEPFIDFREIIGSLVVMDETGISYKGIDAQIVMDCGWQGCYYPFPHQFSHEIEQMSMKFADKAYGMGVRGLLNLDWGIPEDTGKYGNVAALEANLRHNGLHYILRLRDKFFTPWNNKQIHYYHYFNLKENISKIDVLLNLLKEIRIDGDSVLCKNGKIRQGVIPATPVFKNTIGLLLAGESTEYMEKLLDRIKGTAGA